MPSIILEPFYHSSRFHIMDLKNNDGGIFFMRKTLFLMIGLFLLLSQSISNLVVYSKSPEKDGPYIILNDGTQHDITGVNEEISTDGLIVYTEAYGSFTQPFSTETTQAIIVNQTVVDIVTDGALGTFIPPNGFVLSGSGVKQEIIENLKIGEEVILMNVDIQDLPEMYFVIGDEIFPIHGINKGRGANETILYNREFGEVTDTNEWGLEFSVVDGEVTAIRYLGDIHPLPIPDDGIVLSIHGDLVSHLTSIVHIGTPIQVVIDQNFIYQVTRIPYDAYNPKSREDNPVGWDEENNQPYPGFRGPDQVIVYDATLGERTGTNPYGYEFVVENGLITKTGGNNQLIPENGFVVSGHGAAIPKLSSAGQLFSQVFLDKVKQEVIVIYSPISAVKRAEALLEEEKVRYEEAKTTFKDVNYEKIATHLEKAKQYLKDAENALFAKNYQEVLSSLEQLEREIENAHFTNYESRHVEMRAVWMRPTETTREAVRGTVQQLKDVGINAIYLETSNDVYTIYPSSSPYVSLNPRFQGQDMLQIYIEEAHNAGLEVHAWYKVFMVERSVIEGEPDWALETRNGEKIEPGTGFSWISPAHEEARNYVLMMVHELVTKYDLDGFQLDYIRYPDADMGYEQVSIEPFIEQFGVDPRELTQGHPLYNEWTKYRENLVNTMVYEIVDMIRSVNPSIEISASVWPQYERSPVEKMQNPRDWVEKGYIDALFPMSYNLAMEHILNDLHNTVELVGNQAYAIFGVGSFMDISHKDLLQQMEAVTYLTEGKGIFESSSFLKQGYGEKARQGLFSREAFIPRQNPSLAVAMILEDIERKIKEVYVPLNGMDHRSITPIQSQMKIVIRKAKAGEFDFVQKRVEQLEKQIAKDKKINPAIVERMKIDFDYVKRIITKRNKK